MISFSNATSGPLIHVGPALVLLLQLAFRLSDPINLLFTLNCINSSIETTWSQECFFYLFYLVPSFLADRALPFQIYCDSDRTRVRKGPSLCAPCGPQLPFLFHRRFHCFCEFETPCLFRFVHFTPRPSLSPRTMAATNGGYTTGTGKDEAELRRRNVASYEKANGQHVYKVEAEDTKKIQKVASSSAKVLI